MGRREYDLAPVMTTLWRSPAKTFEADGFHTPSMMNSR